MKNTKNPKINGNEFFKEDPKHLQPMNNEEFIMYCMQFSKYGALGQIALIQMLEKGCDEILKDKNDIIAKYEADAQENKFSFIHTPSYIGAIEELKNRLTIKYQS